MEITNVLSHGMESDRLIEQRNLDFNWGWEENMFARTSTSAKESAGVRRSVMLCPHLLWTNHDIIIQVRGQFIYGNLVACAFGLGAPQKRSAALTNVDMSCFDAAPPHKKTCSRKTDYLEGKPWFLNLTYEIRPLTLKSKQILHTIHMLMLHHRFPKKRNISFEY